LHGATDFCLREFWCGRRKLARTKHSSIPRGSGILAIAAARLGYGPIEAFDFDPEAVRIGHSEREAAIGGRKKSNFSKKDVTKLAP